MLRMPVLLWVKDQGDEKVRVPGEAPMFIVPALVKTLPPLE
jgi:hypothetical protein